VLAPDGLPAIRARSSAEVTGVVLERTPGGVIVRATGLPPTLGLLERRARARDPTSGPTRTASSRFDFRALPPAVPQPAGAPAARSIVTGYFLSTRRSAGCGPSRSGPNGTRATSGPDAPVS
jgi:hypothetical protein